MESFKLANNNTQVSLGCGTLLVIALIVMFFSNSGKNNVEQELRSLREEVRALKGSVDAQAEEIRALKGSPTSKMWDSPAPGGGGGVPEPKK